MQVAETTDQEVIDAILQFVSKMNIKSQKKPYRWSDEMSQRFDFVAALLGIASTTPTEIIQFLDDKALTRAIVSSHLQKRREKLMGHLGKKWLSNADCGGWLADFWREPGFQGFSDD